MTREKNAKITRENGTQKQERVRTEGKNKRG